MKVVLLRSAYRDLTEIGDWIARDNPPRAATFTMELEQKAESLATMPRRYPIVHRSRGGDVHKLPHGNYNIYYCVRSDRVEVLHFRHGAQRPPRFD